MEPRRAESTYRGRTLGLIAAAALLATCWLLPSASARADAVPPPSQDPFYAVPTDIGGLANGTVLASRPVTTYFYDLPMTASAWQVKYKSTDDQGVATADVATILIPSGPWLGGGPRPLVSYQTAEDGVSSVCAPSYALRTGPQGTTDNSELETGVIELALLRGWAVVVPDYEGPASDFLGAAQEGHAVLDGVRAALAFAPAGFSSRTPVALWGYSGGSFATSIAAQLQPRYAPKLELTAIALGGEVADVESTLAAFSGSPLGGAIVMGFVGVNRAYPSADLEQYLNAAGQAAMASAANDCINDAATQFPFASIEQYEAYPNVLSNTTLQSFLLGISPLGIPGKPSAPVYDYHSVNDEYAPIAADRALMERYCAAGVRVDHVEDYLSDHISLTVTGAPGAIAYLGDRFAGLPAPDDCSSIPPPGNPTLLGQLLAFHVPAAGSTLNGEGAP